MCLHQDHAYFNAELGTPIVGCWIALDAATEKNGCMRVLRGGHRQQVLVAAGSTDEPSALPHFLRRDWQICDATALAFSPSEIVNLPLAAGDLILFDGLLPHGTYVRPLSTLPTLLGICVSFPLADCL